MHLNVSENITYLYAQLYLHPDYKKNLPCQLIKAHVFVYSTTYLHVLEIPFAHCDDI